MKDGGPVFHRRADSWRANNIFRCCLEEEENGSRFFSEIKGNSTPPPPCRVVSSTFFSYFRTRLLMLRYSNQPCCWLLYLLQESLKNNHQEILFLVSLWWCFYRTTSKTDSFNPVRDSSIDSKERKLTLMVESSRVHFTLSWSFKFPRPNLVGFSSNPLSLLVAFHAVENTGKLQDLSLIPLSLEYMVWFFLFSRYTESRNIVPFFFRVWKSLETLAVCVSHVLVFNKEELVSFSHRQDLVRLACYTRIATACNCWTAR